MSLNFFDKFQSNTFRAEQAPATAKALDIVWLRLFACLTGGELNSSRCYITYRKNNQVLFIFYCYTDASLRGPNLVASESVSTPGCQFAIGYLKAYESLTTQVCKLNEETHAPFYIMGNMDPHYLPIETPLSVLWELSG